MRHFVLKTLMASGLVSGILLFGVAVAASAQESGKPASQGADKKVQQTASTAPEKKPFVYYDASSLPLFGKAFTDAPDVSPEIRYRRLPAELEKVSRPRVWQLGCNSAGLYVRFRTNSTAVYAKWYSSDYGGMNHMAMTGVRGVDLYVKDSDGWGFLGVGRPDPSKNETSYCLVRNMEPEMREYMLYLSLYKGITDLHIGIDEGAELLQPAIESPAAGHPIVFYGSSILQGGCTSRPGMAFTNIIARELDRETINLGFSGNALLDMEIAELMAKVPEPALYVLDYVPNAYADMIRDHGEEFFRVIRDAHPDVPVIFVEDPIFPHSRLDKAILEEITAKNVEQKALFERLKKAGEKLIYYVSADGMIGDDCEATVDGYHFTDLGMVRYTEHIMPVIKKALKKSPNR